MKIYYSIVLFFIYSLVYSQTADPVLFEVENIKVPVSEFKNIYEKTTGDKADYSKASVEDYLDLYVNFKLKVKKALDLRLDKDPDLVKELNGYREQLASSFLLDKEVKDKLINEVFERQKQDVKISHILIHAPARMLPADTLRALNKAKKVLDEYSAGSNWSNLVIEYSSDPNTVNKDGNLGYITAMLPSGFYNVETAIYNSKKGDVLGPVRSSAGYHIIKVNDIRPARGKMEIAHILVLKGGSMEEDKAKINKIYKELESGRNFNVVAKELSEDTKTKNRGGYIGKIGIGQYEEEFENAAFELQQDGDYSKPIETSVGFHIIKRISKDQAQSIEDSYRFIESKVVRDPRFEIAEQALIEKIRQKSDIKINNKAYNEWKSENLDSTFITYRWSAPNERPNTEILNFNSGETTMSIKDFIFFLMKSAKDRVELGRTLQVDGVLDALFDDFIDRSCLKHEENHLETKYPEFKKLMKEYREGILLFEVTKDKVWDKASKDSTGIEKYFDKNRDKYVWDPRAEVVKITVYSGDKEKAEEIAARAETESLKQLEMRYNEENKMVLKGSEMTLEQSRAEEMGITSWEEGFVTKPERLSNTTMSFYKIQKLMPTAQKTLNESRGYVVADYQDELEQAWIAELKKEYKVKIDKKVLASIIK